VRKRKWAEFLIIGIALVIVGMVLSPMLLHPGVRPQANTTGSTVDNATHIAEAKKTIKLISTKSAFPFVQRWVAEYNNDQSIATVQASYLDEASKGGNNDLAITGIASPFNNSYVPVSAQAVAIVYNLPSFPDISSGLNLNSTTLSRIFTGNITYWADPAIKSANKDLNLPNERITIFYDNVDSNSSESLLQQYLSSSIKWPHDSIGTSGPDELAAMVRKTPYSIGYVDFSYAIQTKMTFAAIKNAHGEYIIPSMDSIRKAADTAIQIQNASSTNKTAVAPPSINSSSLGNGSYPIVGLYYAAIPSINDNGTNATLDFVRWIINDNGGQQTLSEVQYPSIYHDNKPLIAYADEITRSNSSMTKD